MSASGEPLRAFVNAQGVDVPAGASAIDAVRVWRPDEATAVLAGERVILDSRGLPVDAATPIAAGAIFRTVPNRQRRDSAGHGTSQDGGPDAPEGSA